MNKLIDKNKTILIATHEKEYFKNISKDELNNLLNISEEQLLKQLTLEEKIGQLVQPYGKSVLRRDPETDEPINDPLKLTDRERAIVGSVLDNSFVDGTTKELKYYLSDSS